MVEKRAVTTNLPRLSNYKLSTPHSSLFQCFNHSTGISHRDHVGWNILRDHTPRADRRVVANGDSGTDDRPAANPNGVANRDWGGKLSSGEADGGISRVICRVDLHVGSAEDIIANMHRVAIENDAAVVHIKAIANENIAAIIAVKRRHNVCSLAHPAKQISQNLLTEFWFFWRGLSILAKKLASAFVLCC